VQAPGRPPAESPPVAAPAQFVREIVPSAPGGAPVRRASLQFVRRGWRAVARRSRGISRLP